MDSGNGDQSVGDVRRGVRDADENGSTITALRSNLIVVNRTRARTRVLEET